MKKFALVFLAFIFGSFLFFNAPQAQAYTIGFYKITNNSTSDVSGQLSVDILSTADDNVSFTFRNNVGLASSITEIYFDDGTGVGTLFSGIVSLTNSSGVNFELDSITTPVNPENLPGGNLLSPPFVTTEGFSADATGSTANGINAAGEFVTIIFGLNDGKEFNDVAAAISSLDLRIGLHVRAHPDGNSDGYVNVPIPAAAWLLGSGLLGLVAIRRRVKK